jgi:hypothetical protein
MSLSRRSAAAFPLALRRLRRSWVVASSYFRTLAQRLPAAPFAAPIPEPSAGAREAAARARSYLRQEMPGDIVALRLLDSQPQTLDAWFEECTALMSGWAPGRRLRYLHDVRNAETLKPHSIDRVTRVLKRVGKSDVRDGRGAILLNSKTVAATLNQVVGYYVGNKWQIRCFSDEADAIRWLSD